MEKACLLAQRCRQAITTIDSQSCGHQFSLSASFGVSDAQTCSYQLDRLFGGADAAVFKCKDLSHNCVSNFGSPQLTVTKSANPIYVFCA
ncbi:MAG: GGDEF domain-containing protein [Paraglaciecola sp.]|jgi:GGDEF domain-containing protein